MDECDNKCDTEVVSLIVFYCYRMCIFLNICSNSMLKILIANYGPVYVSCLIVGISKLFCKQVNHFDHMSNIVY